MVEFVMSEGASQEQFGQLIQFYQIAKSGLQHRYDQLDFLSPREYI